jgi:hypothetical protein
MQVKPGIVAYIVRPWMRADDLGRPVTVLRRGIRGQSVTARNGSTSCCDGPGESTGWLCDANGGKFPCFIAEECLRPLGGADTDETANVGVPQAA